MVTLMDLNLSREVVTFNLYREVYLQPIHGGITGTTTVFLSKLYAVILNSSDPPPPSLPE